jgi:hypothetical protein
MFHTSMAGRAIAANVIAAVASALTGRRTSVPAAREPLGYELAAVAGEGGFGPSELVVPGVQEESTEQQDKPD